MIHIHLLKKHFLVFKKRRKVIILFILIILNYFVLYIPSKIKVAICTIANKENLYIKEFVDYYIKLGFTHIYIYINNDDTTKKISDIIGNSYKYYVTIYENSEDIINNQSLIYTTCYNNIKGKFN